MVKGLFAVALLSTTACVTAAPSSNLPPVFDAPVVTTVAENGGSAAFVIHKSAKAKSYSQIRVETVDGTAKAGVDYTPVSTTVTFGNNVVQMAVPITIIDNSVYQGNRVFGVRLTPVRFATLKGSYEPTTVTINDDEVAPQPPTPCPDGSTVPAGQTCPSGGLAGEAAIPDSFPASDFLIPDTHPPATSPDEVGAFRFTCLPGHLAKVDPIVYPHGVSPHLHFFWGNTGTNADSDYNSLRTSGGSNCTRSTGTSPQRSAYWMPAMLDGAGNAVLADWINTYYKQLPKTDPNCKITLDPAVLGACADLPNGLKFIFGADMKAMTGGPADLNSRDHWAMGFDCVKTDGTGESYTGIAPTIAAIVATGKCPLGAWLRVYGTAPSCWNGKDIDTADHRSHLIYAPQSICPGDHPYKIPEIAIQAFFKTDANFAAGKWRLDSDNQMSASMGGAPVVAGTTLHFDYWEAWSQTFKNLWQTHCINDHLSCSAGQTGQGQMIKGMQQEGPFQAQNLVPLP